MNASKKSKDDFYQKLKASVSEENGPSSVEVLSTNYEEAATIAQSKANIENIYDFIIKCKDNIFSHYCMLERELANLKYLSAYTKLCSSCTSNVDRQVCHSCDKLKCNKKTLAQFYKHCKDIKNVKYTKDYINFIINIGRLSKLYSQFKFVRVPLDKLKRNISWLVDCMKNDSTFWNINNN